MKKLLHHCLDTLPLGSAIIHRSLDLVGGEMANVPALDIWRAVLGDLQVQVTKPIYETWLKDTRGQSLSDDDLLTVTVPTSFAMEWLERRIYPLMQTTASRVVGRPVDVRFQVGDFVSQEETGVVNGRSALPFQANLNGKYSFRSFVVGPSNLLPYSAAKAVAEAPGRSYNPLFMYSEVGLGKTHLLHAIGHSCVSHGLSCIYVTGEQFTNEFISAIRTRSTEEFRARYRGIDVLLIDDIQFISGKEQTQEGFFHTFNELHNADRQVVVASDRPPRALPLLEDRLRSRFESGLITDIQPPGLETRMAILRNKAQEMNVELDGQIIEYLAKKIQLNVRELEGSLNRVAALGRLPDISITLELVSQAIESFLPEMAHRTVGPEGIMDEVSRRFRVSQADLVGASRKKAIVRARHVAMYLIHEELGMNDTDIGRLLGGRSHSTIISALDKMRREINVDFGLHQDIRALKDSLFSCRTLAVDKPVVLVDNLTAR